MNQDIFKKLKTIKLKRVGDGLPLLDMSMVNPDIAPQREIVDRLQEAIVQNNIHKYSVSRGINKLRSSFSDYYSKMFNVALSPETEVCVTLGAKDALNIFIQSYCNAGDSVLVGAPTYPAYLTSFDIFRLKVSTFSIENSEEEILSELKDKLTKNNPKILVLNFPSNPIGNYVSKSFYKSLAEILTDHNQKSKVKCAICNDFVYGRLYHAEVPPVSILSGIDFKRLPVVEFYSLSKSYSVPGWRIGAILGNEELISDVSKSKSILDYGAFLPLQVAASFILSSNDDYTKEVKRKYHERATYLVDILKRSGFECEVPKAGCSIWAKLPEKYACSFDYACQLIEKHGIASLPGSLFGEAYDKYIRFALVLPDVKLFNLNNEFE